MRYLQICIVLLVSVFVLSHAAVAAHLSNEANHWGFKRSKDHIPPDPGNKYSELLKKYDAYFIGDTTKNDIYLTFDNGYEQGYTSKVLDVLKEKKVPATFFITGDYIKDKPELVKRMADEGHIVGNHSWSHPDMTTVNDERFKKELKQVEEKFEEVTGIKGMHYLRPPRGIFSERTLALSKELGYTNVFWSLAFVDWKTDQQKGWKYAYDNIMSQIHPGAILLLHTVSEDNANALAKVIDDLRKEGYTFKSLDELTNKVELPEL